MTYDLARYGTDNPEWEDRMDEWLHERDDQRQAEANMELQSRLIDCLREALTKGATISNVKLMAQQCGISYEDVTGAS